MKLGAGILAVVLVIGLAAAMVRDQWSDALPPVNPAPGDVPEKWGPDGARFVVIADSTAALGEKGSVIGSSNGCVHSSDAWPSLLRARTGFSVGDWSCSSATTAGGLVAVAEAPIGTDTEWVLVALGSNDFARPKSEPSSAGVRRNVKEIVRVAKERGARGVALVDYLVFDVGGCPEGRVSRIARAHDFANEVFSAVEGVTVVPMPGSAAPTRSSPARGLVRVSRGITRLARMRSWWTAIAEELGIALR